MTTPTLFPIDRIDLCAREVRVTAQGLRQLADIATARAKWDCEQHLRAIQGFGSEHANPYQAISSAEQLTRAASDLVVALRFKNAFDSLAKEERETLTLYPQRSV